MYDSLVAAFIVIEYQRIESALSDMLTSGAMKNELGLVYRAWPYEWRVW